MAYPLVSEVSVVAAILEEPATDAQDMAKRIIVALDRERAQHRRFAIIEQVPLEDGLATFHVTGPYSTRKLAETAIRTGKFLHESETPDQFRWAYLRHPLAYTLALEKADAPPPKKREQKRGRGRTKYG